MLKHTKRILIAFFAIFFIAVGFLGLVLPILPGIVFVMLGLLLLATFSPRVDKWINDLTFKFPAAKEPAERIKKFIQRIIGDK